MTSFKATKTNAAAGMALFAGAAVIADSESAHAAPQRHCPVDPSRGSISPWQFRNGIAPDPCHTPAVDNPNTAVVATFGRNPRGFNDKGLEGSSRCAMPLA